MRFDYYQATVKGEVSKVKDCLMALGDEAKPAMGLAKMYRYEQGFALWDRGIGPVAHVLWGGQKETVHAFASGEHTQALETVMRSEFPGHQVTRADAAQDFNEAGAYDRIRDVLRPIAEGYGVSFLQYSDEIDGQAGRTQYMGSPSSAVRNRLYEKGKQERAKLLRSLRCGEVADEILLLNTATGELVQSDCWVRFEAQIRPPDEYGKTWLSTASPEQAWGCSPWLSESASKVFGLDIERFVMTRRKQTSVDHAIRAVCAQYSRAIYQKVAEFGGSWEQFGLELERVTRVLEAEKRSGIL